MHADAFRQIEAVLEIRYNHTLQRRAEILKSLKMEKVASFLTLYQQEAFEDLLIGADSKVGCFLIFDKTGKKLFATGDCAGEPLLSEFRSCAQKTVADSAHLYQGIIDRDGQRIVGAKYFQPWDWVLIYSVETSSFENAVNRILAMTIGLACCCVTACAIVIILVFRRVFGQPISRLKTAAARIAMRETDVMIEISSKDELGDLSKSLNEMAKAISDYIRQLRHLTSDLELSNEAMALEIAERQKAETELKEAHDKIAATLKAIPELLFEVDQEGRIYDYHSPEQQPLYVQPDRFLGRTVQEVMPEGPAKAIMSAIRQAVVQGWHRGTTYSLDMPSGKCWYELSIAGKGPMHGPGRRFIASVHDITERLQAIESLAKTEKLLQQAANAGNVGLWNWSLLTDQVYFSPQWKKQIGYEAHEIQGRYVEWESRLHPDDLEMTLTALKASQAPPWPPYKVEFRLRHKDGTYRWILSEGALELDEQMRPIHMMGSHVDITERKLAEEEKGQLQAQLLQAQKMESVGRLAGGMAHDFNNMLTSILGHAELKMMQLSPSDPIYAALNTIKETALRSADLIRQLLAFARRQPVSPKVIDLNGSVAGILKLLQRMIGEDIEINWLPGEDLWPIKIDPTQVDQVLTNLCANARDAIAGVGKVTIETKNTTLDKHLCAEHPDFICGEYVMLAVSDDGCGMYKEVLDNLFEPFFTTKEMGKGTGLGLATVYGIVKQNDGFINVFSVPGNGTIFKLYLPRFKGRVEAPVVLNAAKIEKGQGETVLLVEDEKEILEIGRTILERLGYTVLTANKPLEALHIAKNHTADIQLLITDVIMPEMNGRDLAKSITDIKPNLKCLFTSGYAADVISRHGVLNNGMHFLQKPFSIQAFSVKVREVLSAPFRTIK